MNVMSLNIAKVLRLPMELLGALYSISFDGTLKRFLGVICDLNVKVLNVIIIVHIFIAKVVDPKYSIILGNPYLASARAKVIRDSKGNYLVTLYN